MQFIRARQQGVNERIDTVTTRSSRVHNREGTHAAGSGKNEVQQGHDEQGNEKDQRQCTSITQHLSNNAAGERQPHYRSEEHTSELQSRSDLVCRLLLEKKKKNKAT